MKRVILTTIVAFLLCSNMSARKNGSFELGGTLGYDFGLKSHQGGLFNFQPEIGKYFSDQFYFGVGTGIVTDDKFDSQMLPVFARGEFDFPVTEKLTPFFSLQAGYDFGTHVNGSIRINPAVGIKLPLSSKADFNFGFGYTRFISTRNGINSTDYLGFKTGVSFKL